MSFIQILGWIIKIKNRLTFFFFLQAWGSVTSGDEQRDLTFPSSEQMPTCSPLSSRLIWLIFTELCGDTISWHLFLEAGVNIFGLAKCCWLTFYPIKWNARKKQHIWLEMHGRSHMCQCITRGINTVKVRGCKFTAAAVKVYTFMTLESSLAKRIISMA